MGRYGWYWRGVVEKNARPEDRGNSAKKGRKGKQPLGSNRVKILNKEGKKTGKHKIFDFAKAPEKCPAPLDKTLKRKDGQKGAQTRQKRDCYGYRNTF